jgi:enoyl-CoA hydratase/carnithine racemase
VRIFCKSLKKANQYRWVKQSLPTATRLLIGVNAINKTMLLELDAALDDIEKNDSVYTVVINGNGRAFCASFDLQAGIEANLKGEE